jgi:CubicO group peptidase (beta-lactamase class C family)
MRKKLNALFLVVLLILFVAPGISKTPDNAVNDKELAEKIDEFVSELFPANEPGCAVIAKKKGRTILRSGYGMANLELGAAIEADMIFRLGSITKQFTAGAIMILVDEKKISLDDDISKFFPDYPTKGNRITIHHLLTHTSGIKSYTNMTEWITMRIKDMSVGELIDFFKNEPVNFKPGDQWKYCNSGYFLLGAIIEKVSGNTYGEFLQKHIFAPLGMKNTFYGSHSKIIPRRVAGYNNSRHGVINADYISMTTPYAAGALISTVDDLATWTAALNSGKLISTQSLQKMYTPVKLNNGKTFAYGYGFSFVKLNGKRAIVHGGGIQGFVTYAIYIPEDDIYIAVLTNYAGKDPGASYTARWIAALLTGNPYKKRTAVKLDPRMLDAAAGIYKISSGVFREVTREGDRLFTRRTGGSRLEAFPASETEFFYKDSFTYFTIVKNKKGEVTKMIMHSAGGTDEAIKTGKPIARKFVKLPIAVLDSYVGEYVMPGFHANLSIQNDRLFIRAGENVPDEMFAEAEDKFFVKNAGAQVIFKKDAAGKVTGLTLIFGDETLVGKKIK